jgi:hypothetical protein
LGLRDGARGRPRASIAEVVANAIGAHHADEPCNSVYAYLVAASDAIGFAGMAAGGHAYDHRTPVTSPLAMQPPRTTPRAVPIQPPRTGRR